MKLIYPTILIEDTKNPNWWNALIPNVRDGSTCGYDFNNAVYMAEERLSLIAEKYQNQLLKPDSLEDIQALYPNNKTVMIEVEVSDDFTFPVKPLFPSRNDFKSYCLKIGSKYYEIIGSIVDYRLSRIFITDENYKRISEVEGIDMKYKLLQIARADWFEKIGKK